MHFGWNKTEKTWHIGTFARLVAPTGSRPDGIHLFEPIIGNGHHWECGGGLTGHMVILDRPEENRTVSIYGVGYVTHLFTTEQHRVFDLKKNGPLSRYMLASRELVNSTVTEWAPVANITRLPVRVKSSIQTDIAVMAHYFHNNFTLDAGYSLWARSKEQITATDTEDHAQSQLNGKHWFVGTDDTISSHAATTTSYGLCAADIHCIGTRGYSHKLFVNFGYHFCNFFASITPLIGIGLEAEFGGSNSSKTTPTCSRSQWGIWGKTGCSF